jgi:hypothetical protein
MAMAFYGKRTMLVCRASELAARYEENPTWEGIGGVAFELSDAVDVGGAPMGAFEVMHGAAPHVHYGSGTETHVFATAAVKRSAKPLLREAAIHAVAHAACPCAVARPVAYVTAPGCVASAIVSEFAGEDGFRFISRRPGARACAEWFSQVVRAVMRMQEARIVHGDLKLNNTCLLDGAWRVIDFGLSVQHTHRLATPDFASVYADDAELAKVPFNASFDLRVFIWSCVVHARHPGPWDAWLSRFECNYPDAWALRAAAFQIPDRRRSKALQRALHAMYVPVFATHDAEFEPSRVLDTMRLRAELDGLLLPDAPAGEPA